jgi:predicted ATP-grasp superfamily ATP-dependent carboligase
MSKKANKKQQEEKTPKGEKEMDFEEPLTPSKRKGPFGPKEATALPSTSNEKKYNFIARRKVISKIDYGSLVLREFKNMDCDGAVIFEGFPSGGEEQLSLCVMVAHYLIEQLQLPLIGEITSSAYQPVAVVEKGAASHSIRIYGNKHLVVFTSEFPLSEEGENDLVASIMDFAGRHKSPLIVSVKSLDGEPEGKSKYNIKIEDSEEEEDAPQSKEDILKIIAKAKSRKVDEKLWFVTNDESFAEKMIKFEHKPIQDVIVSGVSAGLIAESSYSDITVCCLFSPLSDLQKVISIDARVAINVALVVSKLLGETITLDLTKMNEEVAKMEETMKKIIERLGGPPPSDSHLYL